MSVVYEFSLFFSSLGKLADRAQARYFACVNFSFFFFDDHSETNHLRIHWTNFRIFFTNNRYLFVDD